MKHKTPNQGELERGLSGQYECLDSTLFLFSPQYYFVVFSLIFMIHPCVAAVCREVLA